MEQAKARLIVDEHSVKEYFKQYANANLDDAEIRDSVLNYFVDKIYVYDDKITVTGCFSGEPTEIPFTEFSEFDCETVSSIQSGRNELPSKCSTSELLIWYQHIQEWDLAGIS